MNILKAVLNIIAFVTMPLWGGFFLVYLFLTDGGDGINMMSLTRIFTGEQWILERS